MSNIERAFEIWIESLRDVWAIIFQSPSEWNPDIWQMIKNINAGLTILSSSLVVMFFLLGFIKAGIHIKELRQPEIMITCLIRLCLSVAIVNVSMSLMIYVFQIIQGLMSTIAGYGTASYSVDVPLEIVDAIDDTSLFSFNGIMTGLLGFLLIIIVYIMAIILMVIVWGRFLYIYIHCAVSGCFFAAFAGEPTTYIGISFIKSYVNAIFQGAIIVLALIIYTTLISSDSTAAIEAANDGDSFGAILLYSKDFLIGGFVTLMICKSGDQLGQRMGL